MIPIKENEIFVNPNDKLYRYYQLCPHCGFIVNIPKEILPLAILRPISGSASMAVATDIMNSYGVDSRIGQIASIIMGSTETTLYTIAIYTSCINIKKTRGIFGEVNLNLPFPLLNAVLMFEKT